MNKTKVSVEIEKGNTKAHSRRRFIKLSGLTLAGSAVLYACSDDDDFNNGGEKPGENAFDLGSGDVGILNYAYALEQLEAAFYIEVLNGAYYAGADANEKEILMDLRNHEVIHRDFFKTAITAAAGEEKTLPELEFDFSGAVDFSSRESVLQTALLLEDTGVSAYNGAGNLIENPTYLLLAGKIVSVEARHAAAIADLLNPGTDAFARDGILINLGGSGVAYDKAASPSEVLSAVVDLEVVKTPFTANNLPTA